MSRVQTKTDNSHFGEKVKLRVDNLPDKDPVLVLDMYAGSGRIWTEVKKITGRNIEVIGIEKKKISGKVYLRGDNKKFVMDYDQFDIIDLDAYGVPFAQIEKIFAHGSCKKFITFITFIQSQWGVLPRGLLNSMGYTPAMIKKIPTIFNRTGQQKFLQYLGNKGVTTVRIYHTADFRKNYLCIKINEPHN